MARMRPGQIPVSYLRSCQPRAETTHCSGKKADNNSDADVTKLVREPSVRISGGRLHFLPVGIGPKLMQKLFGGDLGGGWSHCFFRCRSRAHSLPLVCFLRVYSPW